MAGRKGDGMMEEEEEEVLQMSVVPLLELLMIARTGGTVTGEWSDRKKDDGRRGEERPLFIALSSLFPFFPFIDHICHLLNSASLPTHFPSLCFASWFNFLPLSYLHTGLFILLCFQNFCMFFFLPVL